MTPIIIGSQDAINHVDCMETFMPGGGLPVGKGHLIIPVILRCNVFFDPENIFGSIEDHPKGHIGNASSYVNVAPGTILTLDIIVDWAPANLQPFALFSLEDLRRYLAHFGKLQVWPDHAQSGTKWARIHPDLEGTLHFTQVKGDSPLLHPFSNLCDEYGRPMELAKRLIQKRIKRLFVDGLALDYCVEATCKDAIMLGFEVFLILDASKPVDDAQGLETIRRFVEMGVHVIYSTWLRPTR